jgi:hypothetical protein
MDQYIPAAENMRLTPGKWTLCRPQWRERLASLTVEGETRSLTECRSKSPPGTASLTPQSWPEGSCPRHSTPEARTTGPPSRSPGPPTDNALFRTFRGSRCYPTSGALHHRADVFVLAVLSARTRTRRYAVLSGAAPETHRSHLAPTNAPVTSSWPGHSRVQRIPRTIHQACPDPMCVPNMRISIDLGDGRRIFQHPRGGVDAERRGYGPLSQSIGGYRR